MIGPPEHDLADYGNMLVRRAILKDSITVADGRSLPEVIFDLAAADRKEWDTQDWQKLENELSSCDLKIKDWLILYT